MASVPQWFGYWTKINETYVMPWSLLGSQVTASQPNPPHEDKMKSGRMIYFTLSSLEKGVIKLYFVKKKKMFYLDTTSLPDQGPKAAFHIFSLSSIHFSQ